MGSSGRGHRPDCFCVACSPDRIPAPAAPSIDLVADIPGLPGIVQLDRAAIQQLMHELDSRLVERGVDAAVSHAAVFEEAERIAAEYGLSPRWLNDAGAGYAPRPLPGWDEASTRLGLTIVIAPPDHLLAMKLRADRIKDEPDVAALIVECDLLDASTQDLVDLMERFYPGEDELADILGIPMSDPDATRIEAFRRCEHALRVARERYS